MGFWNAWEAALWLALGLLVHVDVVGCAGVGEDGEV